MMRRSDLMECGGIMRATGLLAVAMLTVAGLAMAAPPVSEKTPLPVWPEPAVVVHVAPRGSDAGAGTEGQPFASLERARDGLRQLKAEGKLTDGGAMVVVHGGEYRVREPFALTAEDSGTASAPVRYCAVSGETPVFSGGIRLEGFEPVTDEAILARLPEEGRGKVVQAALAPYGVTGLKPLRLGGFNSGLGFKTHPVMELFFDGEAMPMSRWPNEGFAQVADVVVKDGHTIHGREGSMTGRIVYEGDRPARWKEEDAVLLYGYWFFEWADSYERVASIDVDKREIAFEEPYAGYGYRPGASFYALNLLCEIDAPGEWYLDRAKGMLYFYPPSDPAGAVVELSVTDHPFVTLDNVAHTTFEGLVWELGGADAVTIKGGEGCLVAGCTVRRCGGNGIMVGGGSSHTLWGCEVYSMGRGGVVVSGGDRKTLTPGGHLIENCEIHELSRIDHTYTPAILFTGVGNRIARNLLHDIPSSAINLSGNEHIVELNEIHDVVQESDDQGGADMWGNATFRGNVYRYNYWHHIGNQGNPHEEPGCGRAGIRLDDAISGTQLFGNVFYRSSAGKLGFGGVQIHGGKDNVVENNVFAQCMAAVSFSAWGEERWRNFVAEAMNADDIDPALYLERYPDLARLSEDHDVNRVSRNLILNCEEFLKRDSGRCIVSENVILNEGDGGAMSTSEGMDFGKLAQLMAQHGLAPIPFEEIGLYANPYRKVKPEESGGTMIVKDMFCEYAVNPEAVGVAAPRFSWVLDSGVRGQAQSAYQVLVADSAEALAENRGTVWDSGRVESSASTHVRFAGKSLVSNGAYHWKVRVWDEDGVASAYSSPAAFTMALLNPADWTAKWIGRGPSTEPKGPQGYVGSPEEAAELEPPIEHDGRSTLLRREFRLERPVRRARVHVSGLGLYELRLNGEKVSEDVLSPAKTQYREQVLYNTYDVTKQAQQGPNAVGIMLGNGWFNPYEKWWSWRMQWFGSQRAIVQLHIDYEDGSSEIIASGQDWKASTGPVTYSCIYDGEEYDANLEQAGWDQAGFDDSAWTGVNVVEAPGGRLVAQMMEPIRVTEEVAPVALTNPEPGVWVYDLGQNFAGWARLTVEGPKGTVVRLRYAENVDAAGRLDVTSMNKAAARGAYTLKGDGRESYEPRFTYYGFRYVEVTGYPGEPGLDGLTGCVVHSDCPPTGTFACGNELINRIHACTRWSQRSNMLGYPMDCPQRDERLGWMGDAHVTAEEAMHNFHTPLFYRRWLEGVRLSRDKETGNLPYISPRPLTESTSPAWSSGYILMLWYHYLHYGDAQILAEHYEAMKGYVDYLESQAVDHILPPDKYGDWVSVAHNWQRGEPASTATGYLYYTADLVGKVAKVLGKAEDAEHYGHLAGQVKAAYNARFFAPDDRQYEQGSQFSNAFPLFLGLAPESERGAVLDNLVDDILTQHQGHLTTGILGSKYLMEALTQEGRNDVAFLLATQTDYPSWGALIEGRTTLSEKWSQGGSNNHVMFGSIDAWFYRVLAGINADPAHPGFEHITIRPFCHPEVGWVNCALDTVRGAVEANWALGEEGLSLEIAIPVNARATVYVPAAGIDAITEGGLGVAEAEGIEFVRMEGGCAVLRVGSGRYAFLSRDVENHLPKRHVAKPVITPDSELVTTPGGTDVGIQCPTEGAEIRYTLDGREPTEESPVFVAPFKLSKDCPVKARAFREGCIPSITESRSYCFIDPEKNGVEYALYEGAFTELPNFEGLTPSKSGLVHACGLDKLELPKTNYALTFTGQLEIGVAGEYTLCLRSNDGSRLLLDGQVVIDHDGEHGAIEKEAKVQLERGLHPFVLAYFQSGGAAELEFSYQGPGIAKTQVPASALFLP